MTNDDILKRKGAKKAGDIPGEVLKQLNKGSIETVNLTEWLAVDHPTLIACTFPGIGIPDMLIQNILTGIRKQKQNTTMNTIRLVGLSLFNHYTDKTGHISIFEKLSSHSSDSIRCYAPYLISPDNTMDIREKLTLLEKLAADKHFGVREITWMAIRPDIEKDLDTAIRILSQWSKSTDEHIRRFSSEVIRPRGIWCKHLNALKDKPEQALPILENLKADPSKYVQDSVANWLNDASKSRPSFVKETCQRWETESPVKATRYIVKKALRTINQ